MLPSDLYERKPEQGRSLICQGEHCLPPPARVQNDQLRATSPVVPTDLNSTPANTGSKPNLR
jgi:hypothetical protein